MMSTVRARAPTTHSSVGAFSSIDFGKQRRVGTYAHKPFLLNHHPAESSVATATSTDVIDVPVKLLFCLSERLWVCQLCGRAD